MTHLQPGNLLLNYGDGALTTVFCICLETAGDPSYFTLAGYYLLYRNETDFLSGI